MRRIAWFLLLLFAFAVPWEYSLDLGEPLGNIARITGLALLLVAIPAVLQAGIFRKPGPVQWAVLAFFLWLCCSYFWTIDSAATLEKMRGFAQEMMIAWLAWEFAESPGDLRALLRAYVAGSWVLAGLTLANFGLARAVASEQFRFVPYGQDPNDVARFLVLGCPLAALLIISETRWPARLLAIGFLPLGLTAVLLTASRSGFLAALVALVGCGILLLRTHAKTVLGGIFALPVLAGALWLVAPLETFARLATIPEQIQSGYLNQRLEIWSAGWHAFTKAPLLGTGAGSFVSAAGLSPIDTAHNTVLSIAVSAGLCGLFFALLVLALTMRAALKPQGSLRIALVSALLVWMVTAMIATVEENRTTWLLFALIALAGRLSVEDSERLASCFPDSPATQRLELAQFSA